MKANFIKRFGAFILDIMILSIIFSMITFRSNNISSDIEDELGMALKQYESGEITVLEYADKVIDLNYNLQKSSFTSNIFNAVLYIGYFMIFGYLNKGQTIGKKILKIRVVDNDGNTPSVCNMIVRSLFIYGITTLMFNVIFVHILSINIFTCGYVIFTYAEAIFMIISFFMVLYSKDGRGLHDRIAGTNVIEEVK